MEIPYHDTCLLRNLCTGQVATVRTGHGTMDCFKTGKGVRQGCILSPCSFNICREHQGEIPGWMKYMLESRLPGETSCQVVHNLGYADDTTLMSEKEKELKTRLMKLKENSEKAGLILNIQKTKIMASGPITAWQIYGQTMEIVTDFIFLDSKINGTVTAAMKLKDICSLQEKL